MSTAKTCVLQLLGSHLCSKFFQLPLLLPNCYSSMLEAYPGVELGIFLRSRLMRSEQICLILALSNASVLFLNMVGIDIRESAFIVN